MSEPEITELQSLAHKLGEIFDEIRKLDEHKDLAQAAGWSEQQINNAEAELWGQYHGTLNYMTHCFPDDLKDLMIMAVMMFLRIESITDEFYNTETIALQRTARRLLSGFEQQLGCSINGLGFKTILTKHIDNNSMAVQICHDIMAAQMDEANKSGLANVIKAGVMQDLKHAKRTDKESELADA